MEHPHTKKYTNYLHRLLIYLTYKYIPAFHADMRDKAENIPLYFSQPVL